MKPFLNKNRKCVGGKEISSMNFTIGVSEATVGGKWIDIKDKNFKNIKYMYMYVICKCTYFLFIDKRSSLLTWLHL